MKKLLGLAAIGGALYAHRRRGGTFTMDSIKESVGMLRDRVADLLAPVAKEAEARFDDQRDVAPRQSFTPHQA